MSEQLPTKNTKTKKQPKGKTKKSAKSRSSGTKKSSTTKKTSTRKNVPAKGKPSAKKISRTPKQAKESSKEHVGTQVHEIDDYKYLSGDIPIRITIKKHPHEFVPVYDLEIASISDTTKIMLEKIRQELIKKVSLGIADLSDVKKSDVVEERFEELIQILVEKYLPDSDLETTHFLTSYLRIKSLGLGNLELIMDDHQLEEIVINQANEPVWVFHKKYGWLKSTTYLKDENQIRHFASIIGRRVGRQITVLTPLLDAHLNGGDRVNATLSPVSTEGNTITIRKFSRDPWTITKFLKVGTISTDAAALVWSAIQYEMSALIVGGTASGKTSALNVFASFFPPNQRIISIEDTREIRLPKFLHWVPLNTIMANAEGKGEVSMGHLLVNSLRMRPDRILVGEVRRKQETETLFEAIHTGHSVYATFHANNAQEAVDRLTNAPLDVPKIMLPAISLLIVQYRNRRNGKRRTFQLAEITPKGDPNVLMHYDAKMDSWLPEKNFIESLLKTKSTFYDTIKSFTGMDNKEIIQDHNEKVKILKYLITHDITSVDGVGRIMAEYYTDKENLMRYVDANTDFPMNVAKEEDI